MLFIKCGRKGWFWWIERVLRMKSLGYIDSIGRSFMSLEWMIRGIYEGVESGSGCGWYKMLELEFKWYLMLWWII